MSEERPVDQAIFCKRTEDLSSKGKFVSIFLLVNKIFLFFLLLVIFLLVPRTVLASPQETTPQGLTAQEYLNIVTQKIEELLTAGQKFGSIGAQIKLIIQEQNKAQEKIQSQIKQIETRVGLIKAIWGPNYQAINNLQKELKQNQLRISQLEQLRKKIKNSGLEAQIQTTIEALVQQNTVLAEKISIEEKVFSLFGWLAKLLIT